MTWPYPFPRRHSVTCAVCGDPADERRTVSLWENDIDPATAVENPARVARIRRLRVQYGNGEVHQDCFAAGGDA